MRKRAAERIQTADLLTSHLYWCPHHTRIYTYIQQYIRTFSGNIRLRKVYIRTFSVDIWLRKRAAERIQTADLTSHLYRCPHPKRIYTYVERIYA